MGFIFKNSTYIVNLTLLINLCAKAAGAEPEPDVKNTTFEKGSQRA